MNPVMIIGHRGAMANAPENSIESFEMAMEHGAHMIEMDVCLSKDGGVLVMHDDTLDRTTDGRGPVNSYTLNELLGFKLKNGESMPLLSETLERFRDRCALNIELKKASIAKPVVELVREQEMLSQVLISSFDGPLLMKIKMIEPDARIALLCNDKKLDMVKIAHNLRAESLHPEKKLVNPEIVQSAHSLGIEVHVWIVNGKREMRKFIGMGVDGIITERPQMLNEILSRMSV